MSTPATVVCLGAAFLDHLFQVDTIPAGPEKTFARAYAHYGGGMAATAAVAVARLGGAARFWGRLGDDAVGDTIAAELTHYGVDVTGIRRIAGAQSPVSAVILDNDGERLLAAFPGDGLAVDPSWLPLKQLDAAAAVLADTRWPEGAAALLDAARQRRLPAVLDAEVGPTPIPVDLITRADHVIFSAAGLEQTTGTTDPAAGLARAQGLTAATVGVTSGAAGYHWLDTAGALRHTPALALAAVDTLGAGDVFHGAYTLALAEGRSVAAAGRFACTAAGLKCARAGGRAAIPDRAEVEARLA